MQSVPTLPPVKRRISGKSLADASPDMETSQEFTTADFYFDESMPSSIESPPKTNNETKVDLEQTVLVEKQLNTKLQLQLKDCNRRSWHNGKTLKSLKEFIESKIPSLRNSAEELKNEQVKHVQNVTKDMEDIRVNVIQMVQSYDKFMLERNQTVIEKLTLDKLESEKIQQEKMNVATERNRVLEENLRKLDDEMKEMKMKLTDEFKEQEKQHHIEFEDMKSGLLIEIKELTQKHELELEVEIDKTKSDCLVMVTSLEKTVEEKDTVISETECAIKTLEKEKINLEEYLMDRFQVEKEQICDILGIEYEQKLEQAVKEQDEKVELMKHSVISELTVKYERETLQKLDELKQSLMIEKEQAVELTQSMLTTEHSKAADEIRHKLMDENSKELNKYKNELEIKFQQDLEMKSAEFNKAKEELVSELSMFKNRDYSTSETQTSVFNTTDNDAQTNPIPVQLDSHAQTEICDQITIMVQTENSDQKHHAIQTDSTVTKSSTIQTEQAQLVEYSMQTDEKQFYDMTVQTEFCDTDCEGYKCKTEVLVDQASASESETEIEDRKEDAYVIHLEKVRNSFSTIGL